VLAHGGSYITIAECQVRYIVEALTTMAQRGFGAVECRPEVHAGYARRQDDAHARMIWTHPACGTGTATPRAASSARCRGGSSTTGR
jgi:hypothetical protein